jgi:hypothetical protein
MASSFARGRASHMAVYKEDVQVISPASSSLDLLQGILDMTSRLCLGGRG